MGSPFSFDRLFNYWNEDEEEEPNFLENLYRKTKNVAIPTALSTAEEIFSTPKQMVDALMRSSSRNLFDIPVPEEATTGSVVSESLFPVEEEEENIASKAYKTLNPLLEIPEVEAVARGVSGPITDLATDPTLVAGSLGRIPGAAVGTYFGAKGAEHGGEQLGRGYAEIADQDKPLEGIEDIAGGLTNLGVSALGFKHPVEEIGGMARNFAPETLNKPVGDIASETLFPEPSVERGTLDLSGEGLKKLNTFEDSQYRKYGADWRAKQSEAERGFHEKLIKGRELETEPIPEVAAPPKEIGREDLAKVIDPETAERVNELLEEGHSLERATRIAKAEALEDLGDYDALTPEDLEALMSADVMSEGEVPRVLNVPKEQTRVPPPRIPKKEAVIDEVPEVEGELPSAPEILESDTLPQAWAKLTPAQKFQAPLDVLKSLRAAGDVPVLRQGRNIAMDMVFNDPKALWEALKTTKNQAFSEKEFKEVQSHFEKDPQIQRAVEKFNLDLPGVGKGIKEEAFHGTISGKIPILGRAIIKPSDQAYTAFLNAARAWKYNDIETKLTDAGFKPDNPNHRKIFQDAAKAVNIAGSRGHFSKSFQETLNKTTMALWAPRYRAGKFQALIEYGKARSGMGAQLHPIVAKELTKGMERVVAVNLSLLGLAAATGAATVETDTEHTDFGKFRFGSTVVDPWHGFQPIIRDAFRAVKRKSISSTGAEFRTNLGAQIGEYLVSGASPGFNLFWEQATGKTPGGYEKDRLESALDSVTPLIAEQLIEQIQENGLVEAGATLPLSFLGETVDTKKTYNKGGSFKGKKKSKSSGPRKFTY